MTSQDPQPFVAAAIQGDHHALGQLLEAMQPRLYHVCLRMLGHRDDAAEVTQDAMLKVIEHIGGFKRQASVATWMIRIAMNLSISKLRQRKVRQAASLDQPAPGHGHDQSAPLRQQLADHREPEPASAVQQKESAAHLHAALAAIDDDFRAVLVLRDMQDMDYQQIADTLEVPVGTVKSRLFRARLALRHEMLKRCPPPRPASPPGSAPGSNPVTAPGSSPTENTPANGPGSPFTGQPPHAREAGHG